MSRICHEHCPSPHRRGGFGLFVVFATVVFLAVVSTVARVFRSVGAATVNATLDSALSTVLTVAAIVVALAVAGVTGWLVLDRRRGGDAIARFRARTRPTVGATRPVPAPEQARAVPDAAEEVDELPADERAALPAPPPMHVLSYRNDGYEVSSHARVRPGRRAV